MPRDQPNCCGQLFAALQTGEDAQDMTDTRETTDMRQTPPAEVEPQTYPDGGRRRGRTRRDPTIARSEQTDGTRAAAVATVADTLARLVRLAAGVVAAIIVAGILLVVLSANPTNDIVSAIHDVARALAGPFDGMFTLNSADATIAVNWGIAAVVYLILGALVAWLIALIGTARLRQRRAVTT
jgi:hypothetical protein